MRLCIITVFVFMLLSACGSKQQQTENNQTELQVVDSATAYYDQGKTIHNYARFQGIYDHESTTAGFAAILTLEENGNALAFKLSVSQGTCKGEIQGNVFVTAHEQYYYVGFYQAESCPLQFTFMLEDNKVDIKEITLCSEHSTACTFEGTYTKRQR